MRYSSDRLAQKVENLECVLLSAKKVKMAEVEKSCRELFDEVMGIPEVKNHGRWVAQKLLITEDEAKELLLRRQSRGVVELIYAKIYQTKVLKSITRV